MVNRSNNIFTFQFGYIKSIQSCNRKNVNIFSQTLHYIHQCVYGSWYDHNFVQSITVCITHQKKKTYLSGFSTPWVCDNILYRAILWLSLATERLFASNLNKNQWSQVLSYGHKCKSKTLKLQVNHEQVEVWKFCKY